MISSDTHSLHYRKGFTLVELVTVIVIIGILAVVAAPKFLNMQEDAQAAAVKGTAAAFKSAVNMAHMHWELKHGNGEQDDFHTYGTEDEGSVDFNTHGWPAQHFGGEDNGDLTDPDHGKYTLNNNDDCMSVWRIMFHPKAPDENLESIENINYGEPTISKIDTAYKTDYKSDNLRDRKEHQIYSCRYFYRKNKKFSIYYNSRDGEIKFEKNIPYPGK